MKLSLFFLTLGLVIAASVSAASDDEEWNNFKEEYKKSYVDKAEEDKKKAIFLENKKHIEDHNKKYEAGESSYKLKMNHFGDMSFEEYDGFMHPPIKTDLPELEYRNIESREYVKPDNADIPDCINWKDKGAVTPVRDQKLEKCGSCWAHAATGALEGQYFRKNGILKPLSVQNLIDCTVLYGNLGCNGGLSANSYQHVVDQGNILTEAEYPYKAKNGECPYKLKDQKEKLDPSLGTITSGDEAKIKAALATIGPLSSAVDGSNKDFRFYSEGIYNPSDCKEDAQSLDHEVLLVGYCHDSENRDYWLIKNSFGADWGENGYFKVQRNQGKACGAIADVTYPII